MYIESFMSFVYCVFGLCAMYLFSHFYNTLCIALNLNQSIAKERALFYLAKRIEKKINKKINKKAKT